MPPETPAQTIPKLQTDVGFWHQIIHGDDATIVNVRNEDDTADLNVPSIAKAMHDLGASVKSLVYADLASAQANTVVCGAGSTITVCCRTAAGDGYYGEFQYQPGDAVTVYPLNALGFVDGLGQRFKRLWTSNIVDLWYGLLADGLTASAAANTTALLQAITDAHDAGVPLFMPHRELARYVNEVAFTNTKDVFIFGQRTLIERGDGRIWQIPSATTLTISNGADGKNVRVKGLIFKGNYAGNRYRVGTVKTNGIDPIVGEPLLGSISGGAATYYGAGTSYIEVDDYLTSFVNAETITGLTSGATWQQAWDLGVVSSAGIVATDILTDVTTGHTGTVVGVGAGFVSLINTTGNFTYNADVTNGVVTTKTNSQIYNALGMSTNAAAASNRADVRTTADSNVNQHAFGLNIDPQTVNGFDTVEVIDCTFDECIGSGYEPDGNSTETFNKIVIINLRGDRNRRTRKTCSVTGHYNELVFINPICDRIETELNGISVSSTAFTFVTQIIGGHTRSTTLNLKDTSNRLAWPKPPCNISNHTTDEQFNSLYYTANINGGKLRNLSQWSIRDGEINMADCDFILGSTFNSSTMFAGTASGSPVKINCTNVRFKHETGAVLSNQWWNLSTPRAGDKYEFKGCTWSSIAKAMAHRGGDFNFENNCFAYTGGAQIAQSGATTTAGLEHRMRLVGNYPYVPGTGVVLWNPPVTAPTTGTYQSWEISLNNPQWAPGWELQISDANATVLFREGGTKLNVRSTTRWELSDRPTTAGTFFLKGEEIANSLPKATGFRGWRCTKSGDPTTRATFTAESAGPELRYTANDNFMQAALDTNRWASFIGSDGNCVTATIPTPNTVGGVVTLKSGKSATGTVAVNGSQIIDKQLWFASQGGLSAIFRLKCDVVTNAFVQVGFTNQNAALQEACTIGTSGSADTLATTPPNDFVAITFDTASFSQHLVAAGSKAGADTAILDLGAGLAANTATTLQIDIDSTGTARFFLNGVYKGQTANAVTTTAGLMPFGVVSSHNTAQKTLTADWIVAGVALDQAA